MCSVFYMDDSTIGSVKNIAQNVDRRIYSMKFTGDIHPMDMALVLTAESGKTKLSCKRWGYPGTQECGVIFNARVESVRQKKMFSAGIEYHRAVIPAKHFYEWNSRREKNRFCRFDGRPLFLAGFFDILDQEERFVILTTQANESMRKVHDRMPLVLEESQLTDWLWDNGSMAGILRQVPVLLKRQAEYEQMTLF